MGRGAERVGGGGGGEAAKAIMQSGLLIINIKGLTADFFFNVLHGSSYFRTKASGPQLHQCTLCSTFNEGIKNKYINDNIR